MTKFKLSISSKGKAYSQELTEESSASLYGKKLGETINGSIIGFNGYEFQISGGSDNAGFPMRKDIQGTKRVSALVTKGPGFKPGKLVYKRRKTLKGNIITDDIVQVNLKVIKEGPKTLESYFPKKEEAKAEEKKA